MVQSILDARRKKQFHSISAYQHALASFAQITPNEDSEEKKKIIESTMLLDSLVNEYFEFVAFSGQTLLSWDAIRPAFIWKLQTVMNDMHLNEVEQERDEAVKNQLLINESINILKQFILEKAKSFDGIPFTMQRLCELLTTPTRHYRVTEKYLRALEKNINIVTTVTEFGDRITGVEDIILEDCESPIPVERNFILCVDELCDLLPVTTNGVANPFTNSSSVVESTESCSETVTTTNSSLSPSGTYEVESRRSATTPEDEEQDQYPVSSLANSPKEEDEKIINEMSAFIASTTENGSVELAALNESGDTETVSVNTEQMETE